MHLKCQSLHNAEVGYYTTEEEEEEEEEAEETKKRLWTDTVNLTVFIMLQLDTIRQKSVSGQTQLT